MNWDGDFSVLSGYESFQDDNAVAIVAGTVSLAAAAPVPTLGTYGYLALSLLILAVVFTWRRRYPIAG